MTNRNGRKVHSMGNVTNDMVLGLVIVAIAAVPVIALRMILLAHKRKQLMNRITGKGRWNE